jgi:hypothetical protein
MTNEEIQMLKDLFSTVGNVSSQGFEAMVRYTYADGLTCLIGGGFTLFVSIIGCVVAFVKDFDDSDINAAILMCCGIVGLISIFVICGNVVDVVEPVGATVKALLKQATSH